MTSQETTSSEPHGETRAARSGSVTFNTSIAHPARVYDYWLGGNENYEADRQAALGAVHANPNILPGVLANRAFLSRAVRYLVAEAGIRQLLDIGMGLPAAENTHEVAQAVAPECRVVYVDNDPIVLAHARAMLKNAEEATTTYIEADARDTAAILRGAAELLDLSQPVGVLMLMILQYIPDSDAPHEIVSQIMGAMPPGSYLAVSDTANDIDASRVTRATANLNARLGPNRLTLRSHAEIARYFDDLDLVEPGLVTIPEWRSTANPAHIIPCYAGVGRKPSAALAGQPPLIDVCPDRIRPDL